MTIQEDPFASVRLNQKQPNESNPEENQPSLLEQRFKQKSEEDPFYNARISSPKETEDDDDIDRLVEKNIAGLTSRGLEQVLGFPGNIREFGKSVKELYHSDTIFGKVKSLAKEPESFKKFQEENMQILPIVSSLIDWFPTSSDLREKSKEMTGGYTEPTDEFSEMGHEIFSDITNSLMPGTGPRNVIRNIAIPVISVLSKKGAEYLGIENEGQNATKYGTTFLLNMMNNANGPRLNRNMWNQVEQNAPNISVTPNQNARLLAQAQHLENELSLGLGAPSERNALGTVREFIAKLTRPNQPIRARELTASNRSLNEITADPAMAERGMTQLNHLRRTINQGIEHIGQQAPQWVHEWRNANETHGAIANSNFVANYIRNNYSKPLISEGARALFGAGPGKTAMAAVLAAPIFGIYKGVQVISRMGSSPILQRHYRDAIIASLRGNSAMMISNMEKLDKELAKKEKKIPYK